MKKLGLFILAGIGLFLVFSTSVNAMPQFARRYSFECSMCHTAIPMLNRVGFEFRAAGYRLPTEIGKYPGSDAKKAAASAADEGKAKEDSGEAPPFNVGDLFSARLQSDFTVLSHTDVNAAKNYTNNQLQFFEATLYPLTGSWDKNFGSLVELSMAPDDVFEIENAFIRGVLGNEDAWLEGRLGVMHPWEGFGASDRPIGIGRPMFQKNPAIGSPYFLWNIDEAAAEIGFYQAKWGTSLQLRVSNGIVWKNNPFGADPAQGGNIGSEMLKPTGSGYYNDKNVEAVLTQFITTENALTLFYYYGDSPFPSPVDETGTPQTTTLDRFQRVAAYGNLWVVPDKLNFLLGAEYGLDVVDDTSINGSNLNSDPTKVKTLKGSQVGGSQGCFAGLNFHADEKLAFGARFDWYDPAMLVTYNEAWQGVLSVNYALFNGLQFYLEGTHKETLKSATGTNYDNNIQERMVFIW